MNKFLESDVNDSQGNIIISPGLKVRHVDSQFEYTVDSVIDDDNEIKIVLKMPEEPRMNPPDPDPNVLDSRTKNNSKQGMLYEIDPESIYLEPEEEAEQDLLVVTQDEFEAEYEVK